MNTKDDKIEKMLYHAHRCLLFNEMLIAQSDGWLSAEEGDENLIKEMRKKGKLKIEN